MNRLYYGDNLEVVRESIANASVDLIYLDPPFNSNANYNVLFKSKTGEGADAQITAFEDTWHWNEAEDAFDQVMRSGLSGASELLRAMRGFLGGTGVKDIGRLAQVMQREGAELGVLVTAEGPSRAMESNAAAVGRFTDEWGRTYPKLQIITLAELFQGKKPDNPFVDPSSIKKAKREDESARRQGSLL